ALLAGIPGQMDHPKVIAAVEQVAKAAKKTGKHWGTPAFSLDHARHLLKMGATFISHGTDILMIKEGLERVQTEFASLGFQFRNGFRPSIVC
ncbi:MAG: aldolase, partial [Phycisphaerae bacterium]|nr:aldolase [Phycisphaerae bacterium]